MNAASLFVLGLVLGALALPLGWLLLQALHVEVEDGEALLVTRFGRLSRTLTRPGWHWLFDRVLPWVELSRVSMRKQARTYEELAVNDASGTTVVVDVWLEVRVIDPERALYAVDDWNDALKGLVEYAVTALLANRPFQDILTDRDSLAKGLHAELADETARWGLELGQVLVQKVSLLHEVQEQRHAAIAAQLERARADIEEDGRQRVALLEARTQERTARLAAQAKGQYPAAVGRAYGTLRERPAVLEAYEELYELSQLRPHRTMTFKGFAEGEMRNVDAATLSLVGTETPAKAS